MSESVAILITGLLAAAVAVWGIISQRTITRRQVTLEMLAAGESNRDLTEAHIRFVRLIKEHGNLDGFSGADKEGSDEVKDIVTVLNRFELLAIGIEKGIIDYDIYRLWFKSTVLRHWSHSERFVADMRRRLSNDAIFREFETMAGWFRA